MSIKTKTERFIVPVTDKMEIIAGSKGLLDGEVKEIKICRVSVAKLRSIIDVTDTNEMVSGTQSLYHTTKSIPIRHNTDIAGVKIIIKPAMVGIKGAMHVRAYSLFGFIESVEVEVTYSYTPADYQLDVVEDPSEDYDDA